MNATIQETLRHLFQQVKEDPDRIPAIPIAAWPQDSEQQCLLSGFRDMLECLHQRQQDRLDTQERFWLAVRGANDGLWDRHVQTNEYHISPRWRSMLGYEEHEIPDNIEEWFKRLHPDDVDRTLAASQAYINGETDSYEIEYRLQHKDGSYRWILARATALRDASGKAYRLAGSNTDITQRKLAEEHLREKEEQYRSIFEATNDAVFIMDLEDGNIIEANPAACTIYGYSYEEFIGLPPSAVIHPDQLPGFREKGLPLIRAGGKRHIQGLNLRKDGSAFPIDLHQSVFTYQGKPHILSVMRDTTEQVQAQHLLEQRVEERTRELSTLLEVSHSVASTLELKSLLGLILEQLKVVADYTGASILIVEGEDLVIVESRGPHPVEHILHLHFPVKPFGVIWEMFCRQEPVIIDDVRGDTPLAQALREAVGDILNSTLSHVRTWMGIPLMLKQQIIGILILTSQEPRYFTARHAALALGVANQAAIAIENARLYERAQGLAALEERQKLARELHDSVSQALYGISLGAHTARKMLERDPGQVVGPLDYVLSLTEAALAEMRALIFELRPDSLEMEGLVSALTKQAAALQARHELIVSTELCDEPDLPLRAKQELYRIAQEAMHNTVKHAHASHVALRLDQTADEVMLEICDNGVGFDTTASYPGHLGLHSMRERVTNLGGTFEIESTPGAGTRLCVSIPGRV